MPAPVVLFVYNRPDHTLRTVEALAKNSLANESELWIFSDASKNQDAAEKVAEVRRYIHSLPQSGWFASISLFEAVENKGLAESIISGVTQVMQSYGCAIVLEDDLVTAPDFLFFMNACLDCYKNHKNVGSISGYSPLRNIPDNYCDDVYLVPRNCSWGWATWLDRWQQVDWEVRDFEEFRKDKAGRRAFDQCGADRYDRLRRQVETNINSWSVRFGYWQFRQGMNTIYPILSRVRNIGIDGSGVHSFSEVKFNADLPEEGVAFKLALPAVDKRIIKQFKKIYSGNYLSQRLGFLRNNGFGPVVAALKKLNALFHTK